jgi:hypothetical protein
MSTPDITRFLKQPGKHYAGARLQQGRILTDADFNEGTWLEEEDRRRALLDFIGPKGGSPDQGFSIGAPLPVGVLDPPQPAALKPGDVVATTPVLLNGQTISVRPVSIRAGAFYLGGMRFEMDAPQSIMFQRDFLQMTGADIPALDQSPSSQQISCFYYLNAWEQCLTSIEDQEFIEPALGGIDTGLRVRRMRRVQMRSNPSEPNCEIAFDGLVSDLMSNGSATFNSATGELVSNGRLFLTRPPAVVAADCTPDCSLTPPARFLGADNQTLRIMLTAPDRFVWALDDGAPLYRALVSNLSQVSPSEVRVKLLTPPRDEEHFPLAGRVVEIIPFAALLDNQEVDSSITDPHFNKVADEIGAFTRVLAPYDPVSQTFTIELDAARLDVIRNFVHEWDNHHPDATKLMIPPPLEGPPPDERAFYVRFWQPTDPTKDPIEVPIDPITLTGPALGTTSLVPNFPSAGRAADFWIAALRPDSPDRPVVPFDLFNGAGLPPDGPKHFYAPLAFLSGAAANTVDENSDCRPLIRPLADGQPGGCTTVTVGDCRTSFGQFDTIQDAIDALPTEGGVVTILPGLYQQFVVIEDRPGVILEGCGEETVLRSFDPVDFVILIGGASPGVRIRSLTIQAAGPAILAEQGADDLKLSALHLVGGELVLDGSGNFLPGEIGFSVAPLVIASDLNGFTLEDLHLDCGGRTGIQISQCTGVEAVGLDVRGSSGTQNQGGAAVDIGACTGVLVRDSALHTFAQVGIALHDSTSNVRLVRLRALSEPFLAAGTVPALAAVDVDVCNNVSLTESHIRQTSIPAANLSVANLSLAGVGIDAAVVMSGNNLEIDGNEIAGADIGGNLPGSAVWAGLQIRGGANRVRVNDNHIIGGVGHGVTLGSVLWQDAEKSAPPQRFGVGNGQVDFSPQGGFGATGTVSPDQSFAQLVPISEGGLTDVVITANLIENMSTNGISVFTMLGITFDSASPDTAFIGVEGLRIEDNTIINNVARPGTSIGGIANLIPSGMQPTSPTTGNPQLVNLQQLALGGIILSDVGNGAEIRDNLIRGNGNQLVSQPLNGIFVMAGEAISICGNRITGNGAPPTTTQDTGIRGGIVVLYAGTGAPGGIADIESVLALGGNDLANDGSSLRVLNNLVRHPEGRALYVVAAGPVSVIGNFLSSDGFHGSSDDEFALGDIILIQNLGGPWERFDIAKLSTSPNPPTGELVFFTDYTTPTMTGSYLFNVNPSSPRLFVGVGGQVTFQNNQVIFDWAVQRAPAPDAPLAFFPVTLMTLDHLAVIGNQMAFRVRNFQPPVPPEGTQPIEPVLAQLFAAGATVDVSGNRLSESLRLVFSSIWSLGELVNIMTFNQTSHFVFGETTKSQAVLQFNQVMFDRHDKTLQDQLFFTPDQGVHLFFQLLFRNNLPGPIPPPPGSP